MTQLDETIFDEIGLGALTAEEKQRMLIYVAQALQTQVGLRLTAEATPEQLEEFTKLSGEEDDEAILVWLEKSFPNYQTVVDEELANIKSSLADASEEILKAES